MPRGRNCGTCTPRFQKSAKLPKKNDIKLAGYAFRLKIMIESHNQYSSNFLELAPPLSQRKHRLQIFKKLGANFYELSFLTERFQRNLNYLKVNLPLDFSKIFNVFKTTVFFFFLRIRENFRKKKLETIVIS